MAAPEAHANSTSRTVTHTDPFDVSWRERVAVLGSVFGSLLAALVLGLIYSHDATLELLGLIGASFAVVGKFLPLWGVSGESSYSAWELGMVIWVMDTCTVLILVYALEAFYRLRPLKRFLEKAQTNARLVLDAYPAIRKATVVGLTVFVLFPIAGTGAIGATFVGILLGVRRQTLIACVSLGGFLGGMGMAALAVNFEGAMRSLQSTQQNPTIKYATIAALVAVAAALVWWLNRAYRRALSQAEKDE